jgi:endoglucanase
MLKNAVNTFNAQGNISVYIDAGHPNWLTPTEIASRLRAAGIDNAAGFALNIANFYNNEQNANYGKQISDNLGGKHFVVDTGRNGSGTTPDEQWCNPNGRSLGTLPTTNTGNSLIDAYLWIKGPGGSDGNCNNGPSAGQFWPDYALGLAQRTNW